MTTENIVRLAELQEGGELPPTAEDAIALSFADRHAGELRYVAAWGRWLCFNGTRWQYDDTLHTFDRVRTICREVASECDKPVSAIASAKTVAAVARLAMADRRLAAIADQWDRNLDIYGGTAVTVNLVDGVTYPPNPEDYMTKCAAVAPGGDCLLWHEFLERVTASDRDLQQYLQRVAGYCLTGHTTEHAIFFLYGTGANGKSVFVNTLAGVMGDYATTAPVEIFIESPIDRHPTELAMLRGARLVVASETQAGRNWNEARIKTLTGGDRIPARFMRGDFFHFVPQFKLMISGNHKPSLRTVDEAMRRRLHLIPFTVTIPVQERDPDLADKLKLEWPGILQWAINGCLEWRRTSLQPPTAVQRATEDYLQAEDDIISWVADCCAEEAIAQTKCSELYASWKDWSERTGRRGGAGSQKAFSEALEAKGYPKHKTRDGRLFLGLRVGRQIKGL